MQRLTDDERRARMAVRHALAPNARVATPEAAVEAMTVLHSTEPATVYLSCWTRSDSVTVADIDRALYVDRAIVKQLAMRRTLFVFPRDLLAAAWPSASARTARAEGARMAKDVVLTGLHDDGEAWLAAARQEVLDLLTATPEGRQAVDIRAAIPMIDVKLGEPGGQVWSASRLLTLLGARGDIVRGTNTGGWHTSRPRWTLTGNWLDEIPEPVDAEAGYRELIRRWLHTFGPGTEADIVWWFGATKSIVRAALADLSAEAVMLDRGEIGWLLPDDLDPPPAVGAWAALLPVLDPTVMGWKERDFYLGPHRSAIFDVNGNAGTTALVDGRVVGCWDQDGGGVVRVHLLEPVSKTHRRLLDVEAERLTRWLDGFRVSTVYPSPAMKAARLS